MVEPNVKDELFDTTIMDEEAVKGFSDPDQQQRPRTWRLYWRRLLKRPAALVGTIVFCFFLFLAVFGPWIAPYDYEKQSADLRLATPTLSHPFGADQFGRDILSRIIVGTRNIFLLGGFGTAVAVVIGTAIGLFAGYIGGTTDEVVMRLLDVLLAFPALLLAMVLLATTAPLNLNLILVIAVVYCSSPASRGAWCSTCAPGSSWRRPGCAAESRRYLLFREMLPNAAPPLIVEASVRFAYSIFLVASLGFLGLGVPPPSPDWGLQVNEARTFFDAAPWMLLFPAGAIALLVIGTSLMADGLRYVFKPAGIAGRAMSRLVGRNGGTPARPGDRGGAAPTLATERLSVSYRAEGEAIFPPCATSPWTSTPERPWVWWENRGRARPRSRSGPSGTFPGTDGWSAGRPGSTASTWWDLAGGICAACGARRSGSSTRAR